MHKAAQLSKELAGASVENGMPLIEKTLHSALAFDVFGDVQIIMHDDGSANILELHGRGVITCHSISSENILKVLHHYRPFSGLFKGGIQ
jgi:hypothetical protein